MSTAAGTRRGIEGGALRLYQGVLRLYPAEFRAAYSHELSLFLVDRWREETSTPRQLQVWFAAVLGVFREAPKEHWAMILQDLRYAVRVMRRDVLLTLTALAILAVAIGAATIVFSVANALLLRPLPYPDLSTLVAVEEINPRDASESGLMSYNNYLDLRPHARTLVDLGIYEDGEATLRGEGEAESVPAAGVTDGVFRVLGVKPLLGRTFTREETTAKGPAVVVLSAELWARRYGRDPKILGRRILAGRQPSTIVGVMPAGFHFPERAELWTPLQRDPAAPRTDYFWRALGRLRTGVTARQATADLEGLLEAIHRQYPVDNNGYSIAVRPLRDAAVGPYRTGVISLLAAVGLLLLIACANVSNFLLVKASARGREIAVRRALGATSTRLVRQLLIEGLILGVGGAALGLLLAAVGTPALIGLVPIELPRWMDFSIDLRVLGFAVALALFTSLAFGLAPALSSIDRDVTEGLKDGRGGGTRRRQRRLRDGLVLAEVAISFTLLAGAGLMVHSFMALRSQALGYHPQHVMAIDMSIPSARYPKGPAYRALTARLRSQVASLPGVVATASASGVPQGDDWKRIFTIEGHPVPLEQMPSINHVVVSPGYFRAVGLQLLIGRTFTEADWNAPLVIVTRSFAERYWPGQSPLGKRVRFGPPRANEAWHTVVGVIADSRHGDLRDRQHTNIYLPSGERFGTSYLVVRTQGDPLLLARAVHRKIVEVDRDIAQLPAQSLDHLLDVASWRDRLFAVLFTAFALIALLLAAGGLYAALAYAVTLQTHDIGVRMALGASAGRVRTMVLRRGLALVVAGLGIGLAAAVTLTRLVEAQLYGISALDPLTYVVAPIVLLTAGLFATWVPACRATRVSPLVALRQE